MGKSIHDLLTIRWDRMIEKRLRARASREALFLTRCGASSHVPKEFQAPDSANDNSTTPLHGNGGRANLQLLSRSCFRYS